MRSAPLGEEPAKITAALEEVLYGLVTRCRLVIRRQVGVLFEGRIRDRNVHRVAEQLQLVERHLLHLVGRVAPLEVRTEAVALDGLRQDDGGLALVLARSLERGIDLAVVVPTAAQAPDLLVGEVFDQGERTFVAAEEVLAHVGAALGLVGLVIAVGRDVHEVEERTVGVAGEQVVPLAAPHNLDDVPASTAEEALKLLDHLAVAAHRAIEALEVAVDHEVQVVELLVRGELQLAAAFDLVHLTVAEERPHLLLRRVFDAAVREVLVRHRLVDRVDRPEPHRHGGELPEVRHQVRVRVRRDAVGRHRLLLAEAIELGFRDPALEESARVDAGGGVTLNEDLVGAAGCIVPAEEVVEPDFVERSARRVGRNVAANADAGALCAVDRDGSVPADPRAVTALDLFVTRKLGFVLCRDRVDVVGRGHHWHAKVQFFGSFEQAQHDLAGAARAPGIHQLRERLLPLAGLFRIAVERCRGVGILVVNSHHATFRCAGRSCRGNRCAVSPALLARYKPHTNKTSEFLPLEGVYATPSLHH